jgi:hypothetical protein
MNLTGSQWGVINETGSYPGQPWLWLYTVWYQVPGFSTSANVDLIAVCLTGLGTILPRLIPIHRLIWRSCYRPAPGPSAGQQACPADKSPADKSPAGMA